MCRPPTMLNWNFFVLVFLFLATLLQRSNESIYEVLLYIRSSASAYRVHCFEAHVKLRLGFNSFGQ